MCPWANHWLCFSKPKAGVGMVQTTGKWSMASSMPLQRSKGGERSPFRDKEEGWRKGVSLRVCQSPMAGGVLFTSHQFDPSSTVTSPSDHSQERFSAFPGPCIWICLDSSGQSLQLKVLNIKFPFQFKVTYSQILGIKT